MPKLNEASLKTSASITDFGTYNGTATGTLSIDSEKGTLLTDTHTLDWTGVNNHGDITGAFHYTFELEGRAITADNTALSTVYPDSVNSLQTARTTASSQFVHIRSQDNNERLYIWYRLGSTGSYCQSLAYEDGGALTNQFFRLSEKQISKRYIASDGTAYVKVAISFDPNAGDNGQILVYINGELRSRQNASSGGFDFGSSCAYAIRLGTTSNGLGDGTNNYYVRNLELWDEAYKAYEHDTTKANKSIVIGMGVDSFALGAGTDDGAPNENEFGAIRTMKAKLESVYGIQVSAPDGANANGQRYGTFTNSEIDSFLAKSPTDVILSPTVNDLEENSGTPDYAAGQTYETWQGEVERVIDRIGAHGTVKRIWITSFWNWLNAAHGSGFTTGTSSGEYNVLAQAHWGNTSYVAAMNSFFNDLPANTNLSTTTRGKLQDILDLSRPRDADLNGKSYVRHDTRASIPTTLSAWEDDLHPGPRQQMFIGNLFADIIAAKLLGEGSPVGSLVMTGDGLNVKLN